MPNVAANISLAATGADEAAAALDRAKGGLEGIGNSADKLEEKFGHKFQHVGLQLFAGEALRAAGVGRETREVINIMSLSITSLAGAFGASVGPIMLVVSAFVAVGGIIQKVKEHHKDLSEQLEKTNKATHDQLEKTNETLRTIEAYRATVVTMPPELEKWESAERALQKAQVDRQLAGDQAQLSSLKALVVQEEIQQGAVKQQIADQEALMKSLKSMGVDQMVLIAQAAQLKKLEEAYKAGALTAAEHKAKVAELVAEISLLGTKGTDDLKKLTDANKESEAQADKETKEFQKMAEEHVRALDKIADEETKRYQEWAKLREEKLKKNHEVHATEIEQEKYANEAKLEIDRNYDKSMFEAGKSAQDALAKNFGDSFAKMIVEGKSFTQSFAEGFKRMAEQIISDIIRIKTEWAILQAMGFSGGPGMGGGFAGGLFGGAFAEGGSVMVDKPTLFLAGEGGQPEVASFTPLSKLGNQSPAGAGGGSTSIVMENHFYGITDPDDIADTVGRKIIERIRGRGDLNFTRSA